MAKKKDKNQSILYNVHDKFFRENVSRLEVAKDIVKEYLPSKITKLMDLRTLKINLDSFIDKVMNR